MSKKLSAKQILQLNSTSEIDNNTLINDLMKLETAMNFDIYKEGSYIIEAKLDIRDTHNGLAKAKQELIKYKNKLIYYGLKLPKVRLILDYDSMTLFDINGDEYCKLKDFDFDLPENYENYDIDFDNGPNVAQQIYSRHPKINDSNIFEWFKTGIDWYNPTNLTQTDFRLVLDLFNDPQTQKKRGAFYTPDSAVEISTKYLREIISNLPKNKDYVILDRCAGSGQLEKFLTDEELSHCVLSTLGIAEWISLWNTFGDKVRAIIPPFIKGKQISQETKPEDLFSQADFKNNEIKGANALTKKYYDDNEKFWKNKIVILLENPPYAEASNGVGKTAKAGKLSESYVKTLMKQEKLGNAGNDLDNQFIWSAWNLVKCDYYIHYGPIKSWKSLKFYDKKFLHGSLVNRKDFHASEGGISIISWQNIDKVNKTLSLDVPELGTKITIPKVYKSIESCVVKPIEAKSNAFALLKETSFLYKFGTSRLASFNDKNLKSMSHDTFGVDKNNLKIYSVVFALGQYNCKDFTEKEVLMKNADGDVAIWMKDQNFINDCMNWVYFTSYNKCDKDCLIWKELQKQISLFDNNLLLLSRNVERFAEINDWIGLQNIDDIYNLKIENKQGKMVPVNARLDMAISEMKESLRNFYDQKIAPKLFKYELIK